MTVTLIKKKRFTPNQYQIKRLINFQKISLFYRNLEFADINDNVHKIMFDIYCTLDVDGNKYDFIYCDRNPEKFRAVLENIRNGLAIENLC